LLGEEVITAPVKKGLGRFSSRNMAPKDACSLIEMRVAQALSLGNWPKPYKPQGPVKFKVELATPDRADDFKGRTGVYFEGPRTVASTGDNFWQAWDQFWYRN
jgi:D-amino peptidase